MGSVVCHISVSLDGYVAGPYQSFYEPFGRGGTRLTQWMFETEQEGRESDAAVLAEVTRGVGAYVMGRKMFGGGDGAWDLAWKGWWGDEPPYRTRVFVLTHHAREPLVMEGGTTFTFVTDGLKSALAQAREAAGDLDVAVAGGGSTVRQFLAAGLLDQLYLHIVPITLGDGEPLFQDLGNLALEPVQVTASPTATHVKYRVP
ncbi:dihydrofolate reductase family protein [Streptomyces sp. B1866]|uniref:dihydrofolate reductase family protein n=1 Tax=Streptomyces sp. B1866 TaxID=3075431 RepID=UPI0028925787|nr:dihydrofolate reductase family protein [Streptomyces sp. B1866]MDT3398914.1 dihydrofolate reductase family protein [Streptomyces sp. B1866]